MWALFNCLGCEYIVCVSESKETLEQKKKDLERIAEMAIDFNIDQLKRLEKAYEEYREARNHINSISELKDLNNAYAMKVEQFNQRDKNYIYEKLIIREVVKV